MNTPNPLALIQANLAALTEAEQLSILCDLIQGGPAAGLRSDAFIDALGPVDDAFSCAFAELSEAAGYERANPIAATPVRELVG